VKQLMGQAIRTAKLPLDLGDRKEKGANGAKRAYLQTTVTILDAARAFYVAFFLAHQAKLAERVAYFSEQHQDMRDRLISANELLTWAEFQTVETKEHPHPLPDWNFSSRFPDFPFVYRRSVIKAAIGKVRSYRSNLANWHKTGKKKGKPGIPGASNHPTLYEGACELELDQLDLRASFVRLKIYTGQGWIWANYPVTYSAILSSVALRRTGSSKVPSSSFGANQPRSISPKPKRSRQKRSLRASGILTL
jgi:hypothetical protein